MPRRWPRLLISPGPDHRRILESFGTLKAKYVRTLHLMLAGYQALFTSEDDTGEAEFQGKEGAMVSGTARDYRGIRESFGILEAEYTRAVVDKTLHQKLLVISKA